MIRKPPLITLFDMESGVAAAEDMLFGSNAPVLIDPAEAINWIANGVFGDTLGPTSWTQLQEETLSSHIDRASGRNDLAEEMVISAIGSGRLRCVYVTEDAKKLPQLSHVDTAIFKDMEISHEWDGALNIQVFAPGEDDDYISFDQFWFFWDEVISLTPRRPSDGGESVASVQPAASPSPDVARPQFGERSAHLAHGSSIATDTRRGRGRPAGKNGEPITMFVLRVQAEGIEKLNGLSDDALGAMLKEEYLRLSLNLPENTNAARDARGVLRALMKMQVKSEAEAAE